MTAIERAINALEINDAAVIRMRYFDKAEINYIAKTLCITRQAVDKRLNKIVERMAFCISTGG